MKNKKPHLVIVEWGDAWSEAGWADGPAVTKAVPVTTVGFVEKQSKDGIIVTARYATYEDGSFGGGVRNFIPTGMIRKIRKVKY